MQVVDSPFLALVDRELTRAREKHPTPIFSLHEGHSIIEGEFDGFWEEVRQQHNERDYDAILKELVQIAAMCARTAEDCGLLDQ